MSGVNKVILIGNLGKDPEVKYLESKVPVANFTLATNSTWKDKDGSKKEHTEWHNIVLWRGLADLAEKYLHKGDKIYLEGKLRTRSWDDKDNIKRYTTEVIGENMTMLSGRRETETPPPAAEPENTQGSPFSPDMPADDLPF
ncbi:MAG: single-stranded DNA-binding protein [Flavobacteriales bacterium]|nr:single-stranded DNA-binding protein [Flavobacteriales bacterium]